MEPKSKLVRNLKLPRSRELQRIQLEPHPVIEPRDQLDSKIQRRDLIGNGAGIRAQRQWSVWGRRGRRWEYRNVMVPVIKHPCWVDNDRDPDESLKKVEEFEHESQGYLAASRPHFEALTLTLALISYDRHCGRSRIVAIGCLNFRCGFVFTSLFVCFWVGIQFQKGFIIYHFRAFEAPNWEKGKLKKKKITNCNKNMDVEIHQLSSRGK